MQSLLRRKAKEISKIAEGTFSNGLPAKCRFVNGWFCSICGCLTEHEKMDGAQVCCVCKTAKVPSVHSAQYVEHTKFLSSISFYSTKIEFEAIKKAAILSADCNVSWWMMVRSQLSSNKKLEEAIAHAKF